MTLGEQAPSAALGGFVLQRLLGRGGMGEVWLAERRSAGGVTRRAAVKRLLPQYARDRELRERFLAEARITARLEHPNIVQLLDFGASPELFLALEYVEGVSAVELLRYGAQSGLAVPLPATLFVCAEVATALDYAHHRADDAGAPLGIVHRDVSPGNILLSTAGAVKLGDFGIAYATDNVLRTATGMLLGKVAYMAPEQARSAQVDRRADLFSLGVCLWELLTGQPLLPRENMADALRALEDCDFAPPSSRARVAVPEALDALVLRTLHRDASQRTQSAGALARALRGLLATAAPGYGAQELAQWLRAALPAVRALAPALTGSMPAQSPSGTALPPSITDAATVHTPRASASQPASAAPAPHEEATKTLLVRPSHAEDPPSEATASGHPQATAAPFAPPQGPPTVEQTPAPAAPLHEAPERQPPAGSSRAALFALCAALGAGLLTGAWRLWSSSPEAAARRPESASLDAGSGPASALAVPAIDSATPPAVAHSEAPADARAPAPSSLRLTLLGELDVDAWCRRSGYAGAALGGARRGAGAASLWRCREANGALAHLPMDEVCRAQYRAPSALAKPRDVDDAYTWSCYLPAGAAPQERLTAPPP